MQDKLISIVSTILDLSEMTIEPSDDLRNLGLDSIHFIQLIIALEDYYGKRLSDSYLLLDELYTIEKIRAAFEEEKND